MKTTPPQERIRRVAQRPQVTVPREIFETLKLQAGDYVAFAEQTNRVLIKPAPTAVADDDLTPAETKIVRRGEGLSNAGAKPWRDTKRALPAIQKSIFEISG